MVLHCLSAQPHTSSFRRCLELAASGDTVILMGDACYAALSESDSAQQLADCHARLRILDADAKARGLGSLALESIDYAGWVELSETHSQQLAWY